jgi:type III pantothenate kinase
VSAYEKYGRSAGAPVIVVDFGTATTFDAITANGEYLGGAICPGVQISADALFQRAARLPRIDVRKPPQIIGRTTIGAMEAGLFYGYVGLVEGIVRRMRAELDGESAHESGRGGDRSGPKCVATGGLAATIAPETSVIDAVEPDLTLHGLRIVWERNQR